MLGNMIDYWVTKKEVTDLEAFREGIRDIRDKHFDTVHFFPSGIYDHTDAELVETVRTGVEEARSLGLKSMLHLRMFFDRRWLKREPHATYKHVREVRIAAGPGAFEERIPYPPGCVFGSVLRAYEVEFDGRRMVQTVPCETARIHWEIESTIITTRTGFPNRIKEAVLTGPRSETAEQLVYLEFETDQIDPAHPRMRAYITEALEAYCGISLDGFSWDEPSHHCPGVRGCDQPALAVGEGLDAAFGCLTDTSVRDVLPWIFHAGPLADTVRYRKAYYRALRDSLYEAQMFFKQEAQRIFGPSVQMGIHHTWSETDSSDLIAGNIDYPRLCDTLTAGWTDGTYFFGELGTLYVSCLASSLANRSDSGEAYCNLWCYRPREWSVEYHTRLLGLYRVNWFAIGYGEGSAVCFPHHSAWPCHGRYARRLSEFNRRLNGCRRTATVGMLHTWEALAAMRQLYGHVHRAGMLRAAQRAAHESHGLYIFGLDSLSRARVRDGRICVDGLALRTIVLPWPFCMDEDSLSAAAALVEQGGNCVVYGHRPEIAGEDDSAVKLLEQWFGRGALGTTREEALDYEGETLTARGWLEGVEMRPGEGEREDKGAVRIRERLGQERIRLHATPVRADGAEALVQHGDTVIGACAAGGRAVYCGFELPLYGAAFARVLCKLEGDPWGALGKACFVQAYRTGGETRLAVCAKGPDGSIEGQYEIDGATVTLPDAKMAVVCLKPERAAEVEAW